MTGAPAWTDSENELARELCREGLSAGEIAKRMGRTRNAVIGRLARMGLMGRQQTSGVFVQKVRAAKDRAIQPVIRAPRGAPRSLKTNKERYMEKTPPLPSLNIPFLDTRAFQCRAITDNTPYEQKCCGHPTGADGIYCAAHKAIFYTQGRGR